MFESAEVGHAVSKAEFLRRERLLRTHLLKAQRALAQADFPVIVIVSGVEGAGKSEVVNRLNEWLDARGVRTVAFWDESDEERERPRYWRFWRQLPPRGGVGILFGSWYTAPIVQRAFKQIGDAQFESELDRVKRLERLLVEDGALIVKLWFHLSREQQRKRLKAVARIGRRELTPYEKSFTRRYARFVKVSGAALRATDTGHAAWHVVEATDPRYRDLMAGELLLQALRRRLRRKPGQARATRRPPDDTPALGAPVSVLSAVDLGAQLDRERYERKLERLQAELNALAWRAREQGRSTVLLFEGWDAAGKGGAIRRVTAALDARLFRVIPVAAPTDEERAQHYLWRFWRHLPRAGYFTIYDRSWYGRVLVERVEGFAARDDWGRAYAEINDFEQQLHAHGTIVAKFWLHISADEQLRRFEERERIAYKRHKITDEDWRNRKRWDDYEAAVDEMVARTSTDTAPWTLVAANCKRHARVQVLKTVCQRLREAL